MLHMPFPLVNVLTKIDNLVKAAEPLPFNLDYYTEVQDLDYLLPHLEAEQNQTTISQILSDPTSDPTQEFPETKFSALNRALVNLIQDFGLVGFETLAVEDKTSMTNLLHAIDRTSGYVFGTDKGTNESIWQVAMQEGWGGKMEVRDVQERWIDRREEFDELERKQWEEEAKEATATQVRRVPGDENGQQNGGVERGTATMKPSDTNDMDDDDDLEAMQEQYLREQKESQERGEGSRVNIIRKG